MRGQISVDLTVIAFAVLSSLSLRGRGWGGERALPSDTLAKPGDPSEGWERGRVGRCFSIPASRRRYS